jgi:tetratricopeptide (TPR) repeat protein
MIPTIVALLLAAGPPSWLQGDLPQALELAAKHKRPVLVEVYADWCSPCNQLSMEVLETKDGKRLLRRAVGVRLDFDTDEGQSATRKYGVIGLPTTLVLNNKGEELGRVEGYPGRKAYTQAVKDALRGRLSLAALEKKVKQAPGDWDAVITMAQARMVRGREDEANDDLLMAMARGGAIGARAGRIWGRWLLRVKKDVNAGTQHFMAMIKKFKGTQFEAGFRYWAAKGLYLQGHKEKALSLFDEIIGADPINVDAHIDKADFMVLNGYDPVACLLTIKGAIGVDEGQSWLHYLLAKVKFQQHQYAQAARAIRRALGMKPKKAIFKNLADRISLKQGTIP